MKKFWTSSLTLWTVLLLSYVATSYAEEQKGYIFTCPRTLKTGATNQLQLRRYGNLDAGNLNVKVFYQESYNGNESLATEKNFEIEKDAKDSYINLLLEPFDTYIYNGRIEINGTFGDYNIGGNDKIYFSPSKDTIVVIQTDKPLYKEGQTVKFRVLKVDKQLKPTENEKVNIWVEDPKGTRLFQWNDVSLETGLIQLEFPLADEPELGHWKISVSFKEGDTVSENFEVAEYRLPQYEVTIKIPSFVLVTAEMIPITVCAKYTYGKPVKGDIRMNISLESFQWSDDKLPVTEYEGKIDGCLDYNINVSLIETEIYYNYRRVQIGVSVDELGTGVQRNATEFIQRQYTPIFLNFNREQKQFFKPGLPYNGKLFVTNPDHTPVEGEPVEICYTAVRERILYNWSATKKVKFCRNYTSDEKGTIEYILPPQNTDSVGITIEARDLKYIRNPSRTKKENTLTQPQTSMSLTPWYSPSGSFIQLQPVQEKLMCASTKQVRLLFTSKTDANFKFYYQVLRQGEVVHTGFVEKSFAVSEDVSSQFEDESKLVNDQETVLVPAIESSPAPEEDCPSARESRYIPPVGEVYLDIPVGNIPTSDLHVLVHYIRDDRETVADSQKIKVEQCFKNQVKLQFGDEEKQPGTKTSIRVTSSPNSLCGIKVVDKSLSLLNSNEQLTKEKIFNMLESLDPGTYYGVNHCNEDVPQPGLYRASSPGIILPPKPWSSSSYEDSLAAFENAGFLVISDLVLFTRPCKSRRGAVHIAYDESVGVGFGGSGGAGPKVYNRKKVNFEVALASTARRPPAAAASPMSGESQDKIGVEATKSVSEVRSNFPETWLFDLEMTGPEGEFLMKTKLPDTITEWVGDAFCINDDDGLGISNKTSINAFQAFFISMSLPYSVIRGEKFWVTISIFNYVKDALPITVSLADIEGFEVMSESIDGEICVQPQASMVLKVQLKAKSLGGQNITVKAETAQSKDACGNIPVSNAIAKDAMRQSLIVEAEGWPTEEVESALLCPKDEENGVFKKQYAFKIPEDAVEDSPRAIVDLTGNVFGKSLDNLEKLVTLPTGCGEQNMVKFVPNVVAMNLLTETNQLSDKLKRRLIRNLNKGAQNQMKFRHSDGSFSAFGSRDKEGSMFLTAFVLRYFSEAAKYITMDKNVLEQMQIWITSKQQADGCFPNTGKLIVRGIQGGIEKEKSDGTITAYVLISLLISKYDNQTVLDGALTCLKENNQDLSFYSTFLYAYAEALAGKQDSAKERIEKARERAITKEGTEYFHDVNGTKSEDLETAAYAILSILKSGGSVQSALPIVRYLTKNMNSYGGFYSTQDTCVGLDALGEFSKFTFKDPVSINVKATGALEEEIEISEADKLVVKRRRITEIPSETQIEAQGSGCALIQTVLRYNTKTPPEKRNFDLKAVGDCKDDLCKQGSISVTVSYLPPGKKTGMALVEVKMISGVVADKESLEKLQEDKNLELMRFDVENNVVVFYFNEMTNVEKRFSFAVTQVVSVENYQPGTVKAYDYYNRDISASTTYTIGKCDGGTCAKEV